MSTTAPRRLSRATRTVCFAHTTGTCRFRKKCKYAHSERHRARRREVPRAATQPLVNTEKDSSHHVGFTCAVCMAELVSAADIHRIYQNYVWCTVATGVRVSDSQVWENIFKEGDRQHKVYCDGCGNHVGSFFEQRAMYKLTYIERGKGCNRMLLQSDGDPSALLALHTPLEEDRRLGWYGIKCPRAGRPQKQVVERALLPDDATRADVARMTAAIHDPAVQQALSGVQRQRANLLGRESQLTARESSLEERLAQAEEAACSVCFDRVSNAVLQPCYHALCEECAQSIERSTGSCPLCRGRITDVKRIYRG